MFDYNRQGDLSCHVQRIEWLLVDNSFQPMEQDFKLKDTICLVSLVLVPKMVSMGETKIIIQPVS